MYIKIYLNRATFPSLKHIVLLCMFFSNKGCNTYKDTSRKLKNDTLQYNNKLKPNWIV